jgi:hypothetical protein
MLGRHARESYLVRINEGADANFIPGLYRFGRGGKIERIDGADIFLRQREDEAVGYTHLFGIQNEADLPSVDALRALGVAMAAEARPSGDSASPAGYTYLGQFIFHDMTFLDPTDRRPENPSNRRSPALDLDSVLSEGAPGCVADGGTGGPLAIGLTSEGLGIPEDIPRHRYGTAHAGVPRINDCRNDDFLPLAQCHLILLKFYNAVARSQGYDIGEHDETWWQGVRNLWLLHFQSVVLHDFCPRIVDQATYEDVMTRGRRLVRVGQALDDRDWLPLEFAGAVGRFGHSMIRDTYRPWNSVQLGISVTINHFMELTYNNGGKLAAHFAALPTHWVTDWRRLFDFAGTAYDDAAVRPVMAARIDTRIAPMLHTLPACLRSDLCPDNTGMKDPFSLATATLLRGRELRLASAQQALCRINQVLGEPIPGLGPNDLFRGDRVLEEVFDHYPELGEATPLWYYVLREAELLGGGCHLGPLGSRIVMETLHAAVAASPESILNHIDWRPIFPAVNSTYFTMPDLISFSGNPNPLGL